MAAGVLRVLGGLGTAVGLWLALVFAFLLIVYVVATACRFVPLTGRHRNKPLELPSQNPRTSEPQNPRTPEPQNLGFN